MTMLTIRGGPFDGYAQAIDVDVVKTSGKDLITLTDLEPWLLLAGGHGIPGWLSGRPGTNFDVILFAMP